MPFFLLRTPLLLVGLRGDLGSNDLPTGNGTVTTVAGGQACGGMKAQRGIGTARRGTSIRGPEKVGTWLCLRGNSPGSREVRWCGTAMGKRMPHSFRLLAGASRRQWVSSDGLLQARMVGVNGGSHGEGSGRRYQSLRKQELQGPQRTLKALLRTCWMVPLAPELVIP